MRINRAVGLLLFLLIVRFIMGDVFASGSRALIAAFGTVESASHAASARMSER
jgi:hypothetical protein